MDVISVEGIAPFLSKPEIAARIYVFESLESTNTTAKEMAKAGADHGTVVLANSQFAGRGQYGRTFHSPPGHGIYMSIILRPEECPGECQEKCPDEPENKAQSLSRFSKR